MKFDKIFTRIQKNRIIKFRENNISNFENELFNKALNHPALITKKKHLFLQKNTLNIIRKHLCLPLTTSKNNSIETELNIKTLKTKNNSNLSTNIHKDAWIYCEKIEDMVKKKHIKHTKCKLLTMKENKEVTNKILQNQLKIRDLDNQEYEMIEENTDYEEID